MTLSEHQIELLSVLAETPIIYWRARYRREDNEAPVKVYSGKNLEELERRRCAEIRYPQGGPVSRTTITGIGRLLLGTSRNARLAGKDDAA